MNGKRKRTGDIFTMEYDSAIKMNEIVIFATIWMDVEGLLLCEISLSEKDKYHVTSLICVIYETKQTNKEMKETNQKADS